jgi:predicted amidophosphoribosyltransferase
MLRRGIDARPVELGIDGIRSACVGDYEGWLRDLIIAHKEHSAWSLATPLGLLLAEAVLEVAAPTRPIVLVPSPSARSAVRRRGHDPTLRMTRVAASTLRSRGTPAQVLVLLRLRLQVRDSVGLSADQRRRNLADAFAVRSPACQALIRRAAGASIVICDDVMTTGTTVQEARAALELAGIQASGAATLAAVARREQSSQGNPLVNSSAGLDGALTSCHGVRPGP